jgi:hypothetical protein
LHGGTFPWVWAADGGTDGDETLPRRDPPVTGAAAAVLATIFRANLEKSIP